VGRPLAKISVLPAFLWVPPFKPVSDKGPTRRAEVNGGLEVLPISVTTGPAFGGHDFAVEPLRRAVGDPVPAKGQDVVQMPGEHLPDLAHWGQV